MSKGKVQCLEIEPATLGGIDSEVVPMYQESWKEALDKVETILDGYYMENKWTGELNIKIKFCEYTKEELNDLEWEG